VASETVLFFATASDARSRALLPRVRAGAECLVVVAPPGRLQGCPELDTPGVVRVQLEGPIVPGPAWDRVSAVLAPHLGNGASAAVAVNDGGLGGYRGVAAAVAALGVSPDRIEFLLPPLNASDPVPVALSLTAWRRRDASAARRARIVALLRRPELREIGLVALVAAVLVATWSLVAPRPVVLSVPLAAAAHVLTWLYARATVGEYSGDAAIHYQFARRFARGEWFCYNRGVFSAGSSSPLWTLLLGLVARVAGDRRVEPIATRLAWLSLHLSLVIVAVAAVRMLGGDSLWGLAPAVLAGSSRVFVWTGRAMDAPFAMLTNTVVVAALVEGHIPIAMAAVAVACLARWEHVALLGPVVAWACWATGSPWPLLAFAPAALLALDIARRLGSILPASGRARQRHATHRRDAWRGDWHVWMARPDLWALAAIATFSGLLPREIMALSWAWLAATIVFFVVVVPGTYFGRYLIPQLPPLALLAAAGGTWLIQGAAWSPVWIAAIALLAWFSGRWVSTAWRGRAAVAGDATHAREHERGFRELVARDLSKRLPHGATLALIEVDLAWPLDRDDVRIVGIDGVLDATILPVLESGALLPELARRRVTHLLVESCLYDRPGWRHLDVATLGTEGQTGEVSSAAPRLLTSWDYRRWGHGRDEWPWRLWELSVDSASGDACCR
jgi:hypothetical protein